MGEPDWDWWMERLDIGEWKNHTPGRREVMAMCPVHGGGSLHISEVDNKTLLRCFGCDSSYEEIKEAAEGLEDVSAAPAPITTIPLTSAGQRSTPATDPMAWTAQRCGLSVADLVTLGLPLEARGQRVAFTFGPGVEKLRGPGDGGKRKDILWVGGYTPPLWPLPEQPEAEIVVCEGEFDAVVLRAAGYDAYSITGGASNPPEAGAFRVLRDMGVERVRVLFDEDDAGRKGRDTVLDSIREADIETVPSRVVGIEPLMGEKDARDVAHRIGAAQVRIEDAITDEVHALDDVEAVLPEPLLLGVLHPAEHTILYGAGGTGKGVIAAWWVAQLVADGKKVLVVDYEAHARHEWRPRLEAFLTHMSAAMAKRMKTHIFICQPTKPIWEVGDWLRDMARRVQADYVVIDSITYACIEDVEVSKTAIKYSATVARLGVPVLSLGHVTKQDANPQYPFGSVYWHNGARVTIAVSRTAPDATAPRKLTNFKSNQRSEFHPKAVDWDWVDKRDAPPDALNIYDLVEQAKETFERVYGEMLATLGRDPTNKELAMDPELAGWKDTSIRSARSKLKAKREGPTITMTSVTGKGTKGGPL